jgi:hypothetical protein
MKVKIGNTWYSSEDGPMMIVLEQRDKHSISSMPPHVNHYVMVDSKVMTIEEIKEWVIEGPF